jgi:ribosomal protein L7Ae-like RNA K-turn-binding protein
MTILQVYIQALLLNTLFFFFKIFRPFTPADRQVDILQTLCEYVKPLGEARAERRRQRKNKVKATEQLPESPTTVTGINAITRSLEAKDPDDSDALVFVCRGDIDPPQLCGHFPQLCALASRKLIQLQQGSETTLSNALGLKRVSAIQIKVGEKKSLWIAKVCTRLICVLCVGLR